MSNPRVVSLMKSAGINLRDTTGAPSLGFEKSARAYHTEDAAVRLWLYELAGQKDVDRAVSVIQQSVRPSDADRHVAFAQNGGWLLVSFYNERERPVRRRANKLMAAFAGEIERPSDAAAASE